MQHHAVGIISTIQYLQKQSAEAINCNIGGQLDDVHEATINHLVLVRSCLIL